MLQPPTNVPDLSTSVDHHVGALSTIGLPARPASRSAGGPRVGVRAHVMRQVVVLDIAGRLSDVVGDLDHAIELALADTPRGVVCDLSAVLEGAESGAVDVLAAVGRHVRDWPGIPVAVACPDPRLRRLLTAHRLSRPLIVTASLFSAVSSVLATPAPAVQWLHLAPHPTAIRASRDFVTRTLLDWRLGRAIRSARLVVSELVMNSTMNAGTEVDVSVAWNVGALRLTVRDHSPRFPRQRYSALGLHDRGLPWLLASHVPSGFYPLPMAGRSSGPCLTPPGHAHRPTDPVCLPSHPASRPGSPTPAALAACHSAPKSGHIEADTAPLGRRVTHLLNRQSTPTRSA